MTNHFSNTEIEHLKKIIAEEMHIMGSIKLFKQNTDDEFEVRFEKCKHPYLARIKKDEKTQIMIMTMEDPSGRLVLLIQSKTIKQMNVLH